MINKRDGNCVFSTFTILAALSLTVLNHHLTECAGAGHGGSVKNKTVKNWIPNMNFDNPANWDGLIHNCGYIYSFGGQSEAFVVTLPKSVTAKNIILPRNGYMLLQEGSTTFSEPKSTCPQREAIWKRHSALDWFDPSNWATGLNSSARQNEAIAHVERVPCQYDSVKFKANSSFSVVISGDVVIKEFILGTEYFEVALFMSTFLRTVQFKKRTETKFQFPVVSCDESSPDCVCDNYDDSVKRRICSLVNCPGESNEDRCPYPVTPYGFCCPICGIVMKITHKDGLSLKAVRSRLSTELQGQSMTQSIDHYVTRYKVGVSHIILVPLLANRTKDLGGIVTRMKAYLTADSEVTDISIRKSWDTLEGPTSGELTGSSGAGVGIIFVILFVIALVAASIFYLKRSGTRMPQIPSIACPPCPPCPTFPSVRLPSQFLSSTGSSASSSFAFARFSNERVSHLNLGPSFEGSSISRAETVDDVVNATRKSSVAPQSQVVTAELIAVGDGDNSEDTKLARAKDLAQSSSSRFPEETEHVYDLIEIPGVTSPAVASPVVSSAESSSGNLAKSEE